jgi:hypothetical protein
VVVLDSEDCEGSEVWGTGRSKEVAASQGDARKVLFSVAEGVTGPNRSAQSAHSGLLRRYSVHSVRSVHGVTASCTGCFDLFG